MYSQSFLLALLITITSCGHLHTDYDAQMMDRLPVLPDSINVSYPHSNPLRDALKPVPQTAVFEMEGWSLWDPSVIKVGDTYHLFCSRWKETDGWDAWKKSHIIRATSSSLFGPYEFKQVVKEPKQHPWATQGLHNPKIIKVGNRYLLYHLGIPQWKTGFMFADDIEGPWQAVDHPMVYTNNPALLVKKDGEVYVVGKFKKRQKGKDGAINVYMNAFMAPSIDGPFQNISGMKNCLPGGFELEDPTVWWANNHYNVICTDWRSKVTGSEKSVLMYTSLDGISYTLYSQIPLWTRDAPFPVKGWKEVMPDKVERPQVYVNDKGELEALLVAATRATKKERGIILIRPVNNFVPKN